MFNFRYTCKEVDKILEELVGELREIHDLSKDPKEYEYLSEKISDFEGSIIKSIEYLRELNSKMRKAAEDQIEELVERLNLLGGDD